MRLAVQDHRIHRASDVVHRRVPDDVDDARVGIHFHFAHRAAVRIRRHRHDLGARAGERFAGTNGGRGDLEQIDGAVGALHGESATRELDVRLRGLEERRSDAPALLDDLIRGFRHDDGAESHRPAGRRPAADRHQIRVAGDELHAPMLDAKPLGDELGEARFVALAGGQRAEDHVDSAFRPHGDLRALARIAGVQLDVVREADAAVPSAPARIGAPGLESLPVRQLDQAIQGGGVVAAVVDETDWIAIRHRVRRHQILPPQCDPIEAVPSRGEIDEPFDDVHDFRATGGAIGRGRRRVAQHGAAAQRRGGHLIHAGRDPDAFGERDEGDGVRAHVTRVDGAVREKRPVRVECELCVDYEIAGVAVADQRLTTIPRPLHGPTHALGRPRDQRVLRIARIPGAIAAADFARDDPDGFRRHAEDDSDVVTNPPRPA